MIASQFGHILTLRRLITAAENAIALLEATPMVEFGPGEQEELENRLGKFDFILGDFGVTNLNKPQSRFDDTT